MNKWPWFLLALIVVFLDQLTKYCALMWLTPYHPESVLPMLNLTLGFNSGAAFSFLNDAGQWHRWFFAGFSSIMSIVLTVWIIRSKCTEHLKLFALGLILAGALGNLIDRAVLGYVIDFIDVFYGKHHWPIFNLADSAICIGAFLLLVDLQRKQDP